MTRLLQVVRNISARTRPFSTCCSRSISFRALLLCGETAFAVLKHAVALAPSPYSDLPRAARGLHRCRRLPVVPR